MSLSFKSKVNLIVGTAAISFFALILSSAVISSQVQDRMDIIHTRYLPRLELGPRLVSQFEHLRRALQDATAARDMDDLNATRQIKAQFLDELARARSVTDPLQAATLRAAVEEYYAAAFDISRRIVAGETGEALVRWMSAMQSKQARAIEVLGETTAFDRNQLVEAFASATQQQRVGSYLRLGIIVACLIIVVGLSIRVSRGMLAALTELTRGLRRFSDGDFQQPIKVITNDELGNVAKQANQMAASLQHLQTEREKDDWLKQGHSGLILQLRGELEPQEAADRATSFLARYLDALAAALYVVDDDGTLRLAGQYAVTVGTGAGDAPPVFKKGEGLVGQAALHEGITVISSPPPDYLRIRSALGEAAPQSLALVPIAHAAKVIGVLELALLKPWSSRKADLLLSVHDSVAIALAVARARATMRDLLAETQRQAARLLNQEEELRSINEELQAQQEELRQSNTELGHQARELDDQRQILEAKNLELEEARRGLEHKAAELSTVSSYKSQFLANMSHELRTPLNSMLLLSSLLADNETGNLTDKQVEYSRTVHAAGKDLLTLINQVLDLAKIESGKTEVQAAPCTLAEIIVHMEHVFAPMARSKGLALSMSIADGLPSVINTDRRRVEQVLTNLLGNAIKFTAQGSVALRVDRPADSQASGLGLPREKLLLFSVVDTGIGIADADHQRVFAPFEQVDGATDRSFGGTGLGLNIARQLAHLLGGDLRLSSELGKGSTFTFVMPEEPADTVTPRLATKSSGQTAGGASHGSGAAITSLAAASPPRLVGADDPDNEPALLLIEDDTVFSSAFADVIREQGLECLVAAKGQDGLRLAKERQPKGIILDVRLPDIDGWAVMHALRADPQTAQIPVHFVSALDAAERGIAMGAVGYMGKPTSHRDLLRVVESLVPKLANQSPRILLVEDDVTTGESLLRKLVPLSLEVHHVTSARHALEAVKQRRFHFMILDLSLPDMDGLQLLRSMQEQCGGDMPSVVVYTARALSKAEAKTLEAYTEAVVLKEGASTERLVDEVRLFVRRLKEGMGSRRPWASAPKTGAIKLDGRRILVVDDDMRTVYALSATLRSKGAVVLAADSGRTALEMLGQSGRVDAVLMDIMMPEMDGYEAMTRIRREPPWRDLFMVALTAKAMAGDEQKCLDAGASAYLPKPIDADRLLALLDLHLNQVAANVS